MRSLLAVTLVLMAGCMSSGTSQETGAEKVLGPGIRTHSDISITMDCPPPLLATGSCPYVELSEVDSICASEVPGYAGCNLMLTWKATGAGPGATLIGVAHGPNETQERRCSPSGVSPCHVSDDIGWTHHFTGPKQNASEAFHVRAETRVNGQTTASVQLRLNVTLES